MRLLAVAFAMAALLALPSTASAEKWVGKSRSVPRGVVETNPDGTIKVVKLRYKVDCRRRDFDWRSTVSWVSTPQNPIEQQGTTFSDSGTNEGDLERGYRATVTLGLAGRFLADGRVSVRQTVDSTVTLRGRPFDRCRGTVRFVGRKR
jgi:hypothetical protein